MTEAEKKLLSKEVNPLEYNACAPYVCHEVTGSSFRSYTFSYIILYHIVKK